MTGKPPTSDPPSMLGLLFRVKLRVIRNHIRETVYEAPIRACATVFLIGIVWLGLYFLFRLIFTQFKQTPLEATVAMPLIFNFFFIAMLAMLTFSNAIIAYGSLFGKDESAYLLTAPLTPLDVVTLKYVETLFLSSWSLVLLGLPLMLAMADQVHEGAFYVLFLAFFLSFIPIPGAIGLLLAWIAARFLPRRMIRLLAVAGGVLVGAFVVWGMRSLRLGNTPTEVWLQSFLVRMSFVQFAVLPNHWVSAGIDSALESRFGESGMYLLVTVANAMFLSWIVVRLVARRFSEAHDRAAAGHDGLSYTADSAGGAIYNAAFAYLPRPLRLIAAKDLRTFLRDPLQWSQLVILFGLLLLYLTNMPALISGLDATGWELIGPFLNMCAISLILATFTCRFVFPLVSLEGHNLWMIGLLPIPRGQVLIAKFAFAMTVTVAASLAATLLATTSLGLPPIWAGIHIIVSLSVCFGLCGLAVGMGARLPMFGERNAGRIANGLGGTINLLTSLALIAVVLICMGLATWRSRYDPPQRWPDLVSMAYCLAAVIISLAGGLAALTAGAKHFAKLEV